MVVSVIIVFIDRLMLFDRMMNVMLMVIIIRNVLLISRLRNICMLKKFV